MRYFSTFSGIGGFELGFPSDWECVGYSEIDKYASEVYQKHFPNHKPYGDITAIEGKELPDFDLLCGGFPCQAFSVAGKRGGFEDTRGTMFFHLARIAKQKQPRLLLFENVKGLLSHDKGRSFENILRTLDELGYNAQWQVLNSKNYGVPQNRERVFIVGHLRGTCRPEVFSLREESKEDTRRVGEDVAYCLDSNYHKGTNTLEKSRRQIVAQRGRYNKSGSTQQRIEPRKDSLSNTITSVQKDNLVLEDIQIRRLTPIECERLQGFPDNWTEGISNTQRYKCLGNAVTVNVTRYISSSLEGFT